MTKAGGIDWQARAEVAEARLKEALDEQARLWDELHRLRAERQDIDYFQRQAAQMEGSVSWKVTAPLRQAKTLGILVRRKLDDR